MQSNPSVRLRRNLSRSTGAEAVTVGENVLVSTERSEEPAASYHLSNRIDARLGLDPAPAGALGNFTLIWS